jgi:small subunit ribosomal protein S12
MSGNNARKLKQNSKKSKTKHKSSNTHTKQQQQISHVSGIVVYRTRLTSESKNYGVRSCVAVMTSEGKEVMAFVPGDGGLNHIEENTQVLLSHRRKGGLFNVPYKVVKIVGGVSF